MLGLWACAIPPSQWDLFKIQIWLWLHPQTTPAPPALDKSLNRFCTVLKLRTTILCVVYRVWCDLSSCHMLMCLSFHLLSKPTSQDSAVTLPTNLCICLDIPTPPMSELLGNLKWCIEDLSVQVFFVFCFWDKVLVNNTSWRGIYTPPTPQCWDSRCVSPLLALVGAIRDI